MFIIESIEKPTLFWSELGPVLGWTPDRSAATVFDHRRRMNGMSLPPGGCWVIADLSIQQINARRDHFTTIKLRPVVIRLSATEGEYDDLNAQALEFEAALRQWVKGQQILTDGWMVDFVTEED